jgi:hypothetical protein
MSLSPEQRDELQRLLADELRAAVRAAADRGDAAADLLDERRRAMESMTAATVTDDAAEPG